jgi:hypothetical protein
VSGGKGGDGDRAGKAASWASGSLICRCGHGLGMCDVCLMSNGHGSKLFLSNLNTKTVSTGKKKQKKILTYRNRPVGKKTGLHRGFTCYARTNQLYGVVLNGTPHIAVGVSNIMFWIVNYVMSILSCRIDRLTTGRDRQENYCSMNEGGECVNPRLGWRLHRP